MIACIDKVDDYVHAEAYDGIEIKWTWYSNTDNPIYSLILFVWSCNKMFDMFCWHETIIIAKQPLSNWSTQIDKFHKQLEYSSKT